MSEEQQQDQPLAIAYEPTEVPIANEDITLKQPTQPRNLQDLLRYAVEAAQDEPQQPTKFAPMDPERKEFLEQAISSMALDVIKHLQEQIKLLENADQLSADTDISKQTGAFDAILEHVDNIDVANDFHKIGGFTIFPVCFRSIHSQIRASACDVLAELCQNNPYCQRVVLDSGLLPPLLRMLEEDADDHVCTKALYALSCIVRQNSEGFHQLVQHQGLNVLLKTLQRNEDKLRTKAAFLLSCLCRTQPDLKSRMVFLEYIPVLVNVITQPRNPSHEHVLSLMVDLAEDHGAAATELQNPKFELKNILLKHLDLVRNKPEGREEQEYCKKLLLWLFAETRNGL